MRVCRYLTASRNKSRLGKLAVGFGLLLSYTVGFGQGVNVFLTDMTVPLTTLCNGHGTPLPDGSMIYIFQDANDNGYDFDDWQPPDDIFNFNTLTIGGNDIPGTFFPDRTLVAWAGLPRQGVHKFYCVVPIPGRIDSVLVSEVSPLIPDSYFEYDFTSWTCQPWRPPRALVRVALADTFAFAGSEVCMPLTVGETTGLNITAFQFTIDFFSGIVSLVPPFVDTTGAIFSGWFVTETHNDTTGMITVEGSGTEPLSGQGRLVCLRFRVASGLGEYDGSPLHFDNFVFNEGPASIFFRHGHILVRPTGAGDQFSTADPASFALFQNYPNPFNPSTTISFSLTTASRVKLDVFDITGRLVSVPQPEAAASSFVQAGEHSVTFDGSGLPSGIYFARLQVGEFTQTQKMILLK
jgi:hypothetical protein